MLHGIIALCLSLTLSFGWGGNPRHHRHHRHHRGGPVIVTCTINRGCVTRPALRSSL